MTMAVKPLQIVIGHAIWVHFRGPWQLLHGEKMIEPVRPMVVGWVERRLLLGLAGLRSVHFARSDWISGNVLNPTKLSQHTVQHIRLLLEQPPNGAPISRKTQISIKIQVSTKWHELDLQRI